MLPSFFPSEKLCDYAECLDLLEITAADSALRSLVSPLEGALESVL